MKKFQVIFFGIGMLFINIALAQYPSDALQLILNHQEECVQKIEKDKIYLFPEALQVKNNCFSLEFADYQEVLIPYLFQDEQGYFLVSNRRDYYWSCIVCDRAYSNKPLKCGGTLPDGTKCPSSSFSKVYVNE